MRYDKVRFHVFFISVYNPFSNNPILEPVRYLPFYFMKHLTFQISIFLLLLITFTSCEKEYPTNVDTVWTRGLISNQSPFEFLNKNIIISWNNGKVEGQENRITTFTDLGKRETEDIDLNTIGIPQEGESYCYPQIRHLYFVHQAWKSSSRIQNHCGYFLVIESLRNQEGIVILSSEYTPSGWEWIGRY